MVIRDDLIVIGDPDIGFLAKIGAPVDVVVEEFLRQNNCVYFFIKKIIILIYKSFIAIIKFLIG